MISCSSRFVGLTGHDSETDSIDSGRNPSGVSSSGEARRSERSTEEKPEESSPQQPSAQISGDEAAIPHNSAPVSEARASQTKGLNASSGSDAEVLRIDDPEAIEQCDDSTDFADPRRPDVSASRNARPAEEEASKNAKGKQNETATPALSAWSSRYPHKVYSLNPTNDSE